MSGDASDKMDNLIRRSGSTDEQEVIRRALALFKLLLDIQDEHGEVVVNGNIGVTF